MYDFMSVEACIPINALFWGIDPNQPIVLLQPGFDDGDSGSSINWLWFVPLLPRPASSEGDFYTHIHVETTTVGNGTYVKDTYAKPYFLNPNNLEAPGSVPGSAGPANDLQITGWPTDFETWTTDNGVAVAGGDYYNNQEDCPIPTINSDADSISITQYWPASQPHLVSDPGPSWPLTTTTTYSGKRTFASVIAALQTLHKSLPPLPGSVITGCREGGTFVFDYTGLTAVEYDAEIVRGKTYDSSGNCTIHVPANQMMAVQLGPNDGGLYGESGVAAPVNFFQPTYGGSIPRGGQDMAWGNSFVWEWPTSSYPHGGGYTQVLSANWASGSQIDPINISGLIAGIPDTCNFISKTGTVVLHAGIANAGQPVTAIIGRATFNRIVVFPINTGTILTVQNHNNIYPAAYQPPGSFGQWLPGLVMVRSLIRIPKKPTAISNDYTYFSDICTGGTFLPALNVCSLSVQSFDPLLWWTNEVEQITTGEYYFDSSEIPGVGYLFFGDNPNVNSSPQAATQGTAGTGAAGGQSSDPSLL